MPKGFDLKELSFATTDCPLDLCRCQWEESGDVWTMFGYKSNPSSLHTPSLLRTKLRRKGFDLLKELNLAITDCPLDLSRRAPNQVPVTKCKEKFCKDLIAHFSFSSKRWRSIKVFFPLPTRISLYLYLFKNWCQPITTRYRYQPETSGICIFSKTDLTWSNQNLSKSVSVSLQNRCQPIKVK